jgi:multidrug efflux system outer membrane protein
MIPTYERPAAPVAATYGALALPAPASAATSGPGPAAADLPWQQFFTDATLQKLVALALANNRDLRVATLNIEQARAQLQIRQADQVPNVNGVVSGSRTPNSSGGITSTYSAGLLASAWEMDFFGRVASLKEQALAQYLGTAEARNAAQISLVASVANAALALAADEELLNLSRQTLQTREDSLGLVRLRFQHGAASDLDVSQAQTLTESVRVSLAQQERQRALDENALVLLLGQAIPADIRLGLAHTSLDTAKLPDVPVGLPSALLLKRPDIRQAEQALIAANANIGAARAAFFPRITLTAGVGTASGELAGLFKGGSWGFTLQPQLSIPLFDAGRTQAGLESAQAGRDIAVAQYEKAIQSAFRDVSDALAGRATIDQQLQAQQALLAATTRQSELTDLRYKNGVASNLDELDAQRSLFSAQQALVQTRLLLLQNRINLYKALGGGWA